VPSVTCYWRAPTAARSASIAFLRRSSGNASPTTALRDINELLARGVLRKSEAGGRSTSYELNELTVE